ncbi:hypothetical protein M8J76_013442 [Diaphorina citri]|nr:hypothetical protein M8J75_012813 [Diaphorina citri]KAI5730415.1 hypothetical protein M8J76_013442 [Diaphorina citri]
MLQSVFGTLKIHDFDSPDYLQTPDSNDNNNNAKTDADSGDRTMTVTSTGSPTHLEKHKNALMMTDLDNGAYLRLAPFNGKNVNIYDNYLQDIEEHGDEETHIKENYTNR